jgi:hypothetical protein
LTTMRSAIMRHAPEIDETRFEGCSCGVTTGA